MDNSIESKISKIANQSKELKHAVLSKQDISFVEKELAVSFSDAFKELNGKLRYDYFLAFEFFNFQTKNPYSVVEETMQLRENCGLPNYYIILAIQDDVTAVLLESKSADYPENRVIFCTLYDFQNLCESKTMEENPRIFPTFSNFFSYLLDEEEKRRAEEKSL